MPTDLSQLSDEQLSVYRDLLARKQGGGMSPGNGAPPVPYHIPTEGQIDPYSQPARYNRFSAAHPTAAKVLKPLQTAAEHMPGPETVASFGTPMAAGEAAPLSTLGRGLRTVGKVLKDPKVRAAGFKALVPHGKELLQWKKVGGEALQRVRENPALKDPEPFSLTPPASPPPAGSQGRLFRTGEDIDLHGLDEDPLAPVSYFKKAREGVARVEAESKVEASASGGEGTKTEGAKTETGSSDRLAEHKAYWDKVWEIADSKLADHLKTKGVTRPDQVDSLTDEQINEYRKAVGQRKIGSSGGSRNTQTVRDGLKSALNKGGGEPDSAAADLMLQAVRRLEPIKGVPVSTLRLREALPQLSKAEFDRAAVLLRKQRRAFLSQHADPNNISDADRDLLIEDEYERSAHEMSDEHYKPTPGKKSYYVGVSERPH